MSPRARQDGRVSTAFPPEPWDLTSGLLLTVLRVPPAVVPGLPDAVPAGHRPVLLGGDAVLGLAFVRYAEPGTLVYDELLTAVLTSPARPAAHVTIPQIWVTSPASRAGGRDLWGIPKDLCEVVRHSTATAHHVEVRADGARVARLTARPGPRLLPGRIRVPLTTAQRRLDPEGAGGVVVSTNTVRPVVRTLRARWEIAPDGPLRHLLGRPALGSVALTDAAVVFGARVERS